MLTSKQNKTRISEFSKLDCTDTQPITTTNTTCNFTYIGIVGSVAKNLAILQNQ